MEEILQQFLSWSYPLIECVILILIITRKEMKGKALLIVSFGLSLSISLLWKIPSLLSMIGIVDGYTLSEFFGWLRYPSRIANLIALGLFIPYIFNASDNQSQSTDNTRTDI